jgi:hypothetical protein
MHRQTAAGETPLELSARKGHHQAAQVLRQLERAARAGRQDTPETREAAERMAAALIEEEEREQAAKTQRKVRGAPLSRTFV